MAASNAAADNVRVFNKTVSGVPAANPVMISDSVFSPEFGSGLVVEGLDRAGESLWRDHEIRKPEHWRSH